MLRAMKSFFRNAIADVITAGRFGRLLGRGRSASLTVLCYHRVLPEDRRRAYFCSDLVVTPGALEAHVAFCSQRFDCRPLADAVTALDGNRGADRPLLSITFDDGYWDNFAFARPILEKHGVRATFFIISSLVGSASASWFDRLGRALQHVRITEANGRMPHSALQADVGDHWLQCHRRRLFSAGPLELVKAAKKLDPALREAVVAAAERSAMTTGWRPNEQDRVMTEDEIRQLASEGHEIGSHTRTHPILTGLVTDALDEELQRSRRELERITGIPVRSLAYPNGDYNGIVIDSARRCGYRYAVTTESGLNTLASNPMRLRRTFISQDRTSRANGEFSASLLDLEVTGVADAVFFRSFRRGVLNGPRRARRHR